MTALIHCNGPSCTKTRAPDTRPGAWRTDDGWLVVFRAEEELGDFCSYECLGRWGCEVGIVHRRESAAERQQGVEDRWPNGPTDEQKELLAREHGGLHDFQGG